MSSFSASSGTTTAAAADPAALLVRIAELEKRLLSANSEGDGADDANVPPPTTGRPFHGTYTAAAYPCTAAAATAGNDSNPVATATGKPADADADAKELVLEVVDPAARRFLSKRERKKEAKRARKAASFLEKTELHASKACGVVGAKDRVVVPEYMVNGGSDVKWEPDPCDIDLKGIILPDEYFEAITAINEACAHARAAPIDLALAISAGFLLLPLIPWAIRHRRHRTKHKKILVEQIRLFNNRYAPRGVRMRWRRKPHSQLVIERFPLPSGATVASCRREAGGVVAGGGGSGAVATPAAGGAVATPAAGGAEEGGGKQ